MKQLNNAALMYAQDYDETFPGNINGSHLPGSPQIFWWQSLPPYIQKGVQIDATKAYDKTANASNVGGVFQCPSAQPEENLLQNTPQALNYVPAGSVVEFNQIPTGQPGAGQSQGGPALADFTKPAGTAWLAENGVFNRNSPNMTFMGRVMKDTGLMFNGVHSVGGAVSNSDPTPSTDPSSAAFNPKSKPIGVSGGQRRVSYRHSGGMNLAYVDGHCKWIKGEQVFESVKKAQQAEASGTPSYTTLFDVRQPN